MINLSFLLLFFPCRDGPSYVIAPPIVLRAPGIISGCFQPSHHRYGTYTAIAMAYVIDDVH